jgi:hypothetical protein
MSLGFNSKVQLDGGLYDVQTEDRGLVHPFIDTLVLLQGQVLHRCSRSYEDLVDKGKVDEDLLRGRVEQQHREILDALRGGTLALQKAALSDTAALAIKLCNAGSWLVAGKASLDVLVCTRRDSRPAAGADVEVSIQGAVADSKAFSAKTDKDGRALISFVLPDIADTENAVLVIRASLGEMRDQIRYRLRAKSHDPAGGVR